MSEEPTGSDFTLANAGLTPAPISPEPAEKEQYGAGFEELKRAANDHTAERGDGSETPLIKRELSWISGPKAGQTVDLKAERMSLTPEAAAKVLSQTHRTEDEIEAHTNLQALAADVDRTRAWAAGQEPQADAQQSAQTEQPQQPQPDSPQPESETPSGVSPKVAAALADPEIRQAIEASIAPAAQARQQYEQGLAQLTEFSAASVLAKLQSKYPTITGPQIPAAMQLLESQDPQFFAEIRSDANRALSLVRASQEVQAHNHAAMTQQQQQRFQQWSKAEDAKVEAAIPEIANDPDMKVSKAAIKTLKDVGFDESDLAKAWHGEVALSLRDSRAQILIWKAAQYDMARAGIGRPEPKPLPAVQRPGIAPSAGERSAVDLSELRNEFKRASGNEQLRLGAKLMRLQRGG